jgi:hypothetical protein
MSDTPSGIQGAPRPQKECFSQGRKMFHGLGLVITGSSGCHPLDFVYNTQLLAVLEAMLEYGCAMYRESN